VYENEQDLAGLDKGHTYDSCLPHSQVYEDEQDLHLVMELCQGGDWFEHLLTDGRSAEILCQKGGWFEHLLSRTSLK